MLGRHYADPIASLRQSLSVSQRSSCKVSVAANKVRAARSFGIMTRTESEVCLELQFPTRKRRCFITTVEMPRFIEALEQEGSEYGRHGIWLLLFTGLRMRELVSAKWADIDRDMGTLFIGLTKNGDPLLAPLSEAAIERLQMIPRIADNPYIICGRNPGDHFKDLRTVLQRVLARAGLQNIRIHDLREP